MMIRVGSPLTVIPIWGYLLFFAAICMAGQMVFHHSRYVSIDKWLTLSLFSYFAVLFVVHVSWLELLKGLAWPSLTLDVGVWLIVVAILGTTISPNLFFWQAAQELDDTKAKPAEMPLLQKPGQGPATLSRICLDTLVALDGVSLETVHPRDNLYFHRLGSIQPIACLVERG